MKLRPRLFFSFRSPYSWILLERLRARLPGVWTEFDLIPYWEPDERAAAALSRRGAVLHYRQMGKARHLYILHDTKRIARRLGLKMLWPVDDQPWWEPSHLGWLQAQSLGRGEAFYLSVTAARWNRGENISSQAVIAQAARVAGLDPELIVGAVEDERIRAAGVAALETAFLHDVFGVPYLMLGRQRFWGQDRLEDFLEEYLPSRGAQSAGERGRSPPVAPVHSA